ncbi:MAG TPA: glycoside hydrolase family 16 protein [Verrucomicrobiae bacterium]|jgi:beta-glucanase (GH16 family)|nr:glycoside hydrolase family 16 protein [Verrucomicrobiae bacterium]
MVKSVFSARAGLTLLLSVFIGFGLSARAASLLSNPGFEFDPASPNTTFPGWTRYGVNTYNETGAPAAHSGTNYFKVYQAFNGALNTNGVYQDYIAGPGATYSADGWADTAASDTLAGQNVAWIEVTFHDAGAKVLALYRSAVISTNLIASGAFPKNTWNDLQVTNQYDINSLQVTNTVAQLVAPPGTVFLRYQILLRGGPDSAGGSVYFDDLNLTRISAAPYGDMNIIWSDEFDGTAINPKIWTYDTGAGGWGNNELEDYTSRTNNAFVANGMLHIVGRQESLGNSHYTSARLKSDGHFSFTYGRLEWRAQLPYGVGLWPALWMLGTNISVSSIGWPDCGEIDVLENKGTNVTKAQSSIHYGGDGTATYTFTDGQAATNFHTYTLDWTTNTMLFYVDGHLFETQNSPWGNTDGASPFPFNKPAFLLMNMAVGGNYVGNPDQTNIDAGTVFPAEFLVDYVRIYTTTQPFRLAVMQTSSNIILSWPSNIVCHLQAQTDAPPSGIGNNWIQVGTTTNQAQIIPMTSSAYFRLVTP